MPERKAAARRQARVRENLHLLPKDAQEAILESFEADKQSAHKYDDPDTASIPTQRRN
jgi:phospholipid/cholesterol/gamma-HCH transport system ATP-binding protein